MPKFLSLRMKPFKRRFIYSLIHFSYWEIIHVNIQCEYYGKKLENSGFWLKEVCVIIPNGRMSSFLAQGKEFQKKSESMGSNPVEPIFLRCPKIWLRIQLLHTLPQTWPRMFRSSCYVGCALHHFNTGWEVLLDALTSSIN